MKVSAVAKEAYQSMDKKREVKNAAASAAISAGATLILNKGNPKLAARVGLFSAGLSVIIGAVQYAHFAYKNLKAKENDTKNEGLNNAINDTKVSCHQG